jgi:hypothetical protein
MDQDGRDYPIPEKAIDLRLCQSPEKNIDASVDLAFLSPYHWGKKYLTKETMPDYDALDASRKSIYQLTIPKAHILGIQVQEHSIVSPYGTPYNLLRIILTVTEEFGDEKELKKQTPAKKSDMFHDLGRWEPKDKDRPYGAQERVGGYGLFNVREWIPTGKATEICIFQEVIVDVGSDETWRYTRDIDNHVFGGYQSLVQTLQGYLGVSASSSRWYY